MRTFREPTSETFRYGFLTSRTARLLYQHSAHTPLKDEDRRLLSRAEQFVQQILNGEEFVSGEKENLTENLEPLNVLRYGRDALTVLEQMSVIANLNDRSDLRDALISIQTTLGTIKEASQAAAVDPETVQQAAKFFDVIADALMEEALELSHPIVPAAT